MIKINCKDKYFLSIFNNLLEQKNFFFNSSSDNHYAIINIEVNLNNILLDINGNRVKLSLPIDTNLFFKQILKMISDIKILIGKYYYFPYQRLLISNEDRTMLSDIQNTIFSNLINSPMGLNKNKLYNIIWKKDKDISINKLDTHLTNLKNQLKDDLGIKAKFQSRDKMLTLLID